MIFNFKNLFYCFFLYFNIFRQYKILYIDNFESSSTDETVDSWFLMSSPGPVVSIVGLYLLFVLKIGPAYMRDRKPYDLKKVMVIYNAFQVCYSMWMCRTVST